MQKYNSDIFRKQKRLNFLPFLLECPAKEAVQLKTLLEMRHKKVITNTCALKWVVHRTDT
jgi:hypothetical protein